MINGDGGCSYIGGPVAQASLLGAKVGGHLMPVLYSSHEPSQLSQWLYHEEKTLS